MSFSITNNSATAVVTDISTASSTYGTFSISSGSFPLLSGQTISGTNTLISNLKGSPYGTIQLFLNSGDAQIEVYINTTLYSALDYSSGIASIQVPIIQAGDTIQINIDEADLPVPSATPTATPTMTVTPTTTATPTPSVTPTFTPTPSSTPPITNPQTLGALWWIDFTDASTLTFSGSNVDTATDKISSVVFTADTGNGPVYDSTGYLGVSGDVRTNATQLRNDGLSYGSSFTEYTWFGRVEDDVVSQRGGKIIIGTNNNDPWPSGLAFVLMIDPNTGPSPVWRFQNRGSAGGAVQVNTDITFSAFTNVAMRSYNSGSDLVLEVWENGSIISSGTTGGDSCVTVNNPIFSLMFDGGQDFNTEQFFFSSKLTNGQMAQAFQYLTDKY